MQPKAFELACSTSCFPTATRYEDLCSARDMGFHLCEVVLGAEDVEESGLQRWAGLLEKSTLECWSVHTPFGTHANLANPEPGERRVALDLVLDAVEMAKKLGAAVVVIHGGAEPVPAEHRELYLQASRLSLTSVAARCEKLGLVMALEFLPRTCPGNSVSELTRLLDGLDGAGVCLDLNHANLDQDLTANIYALADRIVTLHVSDNDGIDERHWLPGQGVIAWPETVAALRDIGYKGPFLYEAGKDRSERVVTPQMLAANYEGMILSLLN